ncbi:hypothetical protein QUB33_20590 [Microcoleus sp. B3-A4]|uniref:hypothetical protein n=1 Tax=Microcoleus sp. B3-A4 TaxID=2818653 RepID=UPI002FD30582
MKNKTFFIHIGKTAGSSFNAFLKENFRGEEHCENYLERGNVFTRLDYLKSLDYISGHITLDVFEKSFPKKDYFLMTFLRFPVNQLISNINWLIHIYDISPKFFANHPKHIQEISLELRSLNLYDPDSFINALNKFQNLFKNNQSRYFGLPPFLGDVETIIGKIKTLDLVGLTEDYQGAIDNFIRLNELNIKPKLHQENRNLSYRINKDILDNQIIADFIQEYNQVDILVYEYFLRRNQTNSSYTATKIDPCTQLINLREVHQKSENLENLLKKTQEELAQADFQVHRTQCYFQQYKAQAYKALALLQTSQVQVHRSVTLLQTSQAQLHQIQDELAQTQAQLQQAQKERDQYQSRLNLMQWELDRSQFQLAIASQTLESSQVQYKLLVWDAWYAYTKGDLAGMSQCLHASVKCTPFSKTKTISSWLNSFAEFSVNKGESLDVQSLSNTYEWKQVIDRIFGYPKMTAN